MPSTDDLVAQYSEILAAHGPGSEEAQGFYNEHMNDEEFAELARMLDSLRQIHAQESVESSRTMRSSGWLRSVTVILAFCVVIVIVGSLSVMVLQANHDRKAAFEDRMEVVEVTESIGASMGDIDSAEQAARFKTPLNLQAEDGNDVDVKEIIPDLENATKDKLRIFERLALQVPKEKRDEWDPDAQYALVRAAFLQDDETEIQQRIDWVKSNHPQWSRIHYAQGVLEQKQGHEAEAIAAYQKAIGLNTSEMEDGDKPFALPGNNLAYLYLIQSKENKDTGQALVALKTIDEALKRDVKFTDASGRWNDDRLLDTKAVILETLADAILEHWESSVTISQTPLQLRVEARDLFHDAQIVSPVRSRREQFSKKVRQLNSTIAEMEQHESNR